MKAALIRVAVLHWSVNDGQKKGDHPIAPVNVYGLRRH